MPSKAASRNSADKLVEIDRQVNDALAPGRGGVASEAISVVTKIADQPQLRLISAATIGAGLLTSNPRLTRSGARMLLAHEIATLSKNFIKDSVDRTRPRSAKSTPERRPRPGRNPEKEESSFPSGHTAGAVSVAAAFSREYPEYRIPALLAAGLVAAALIPRRAHYLSDVGAGALVGAASELVASALWWGERSQPRSR